MKGKPVVRSADVRDGVRELGVRAGDCLLVHSSLSSFGYVEGAADGVIDGLLEALGPEGTLVLPTLTWNLVHCDNPVFDPRSTPSVVGLITEVFRKRPGVLRSLHPTHSCAATGPGAARLLQDHEKDVTPCGRRSPYARLIAAGGKILFLGVDLACNTTFHALEEMAVVPYLFDRCEDLYSIGPDGRKIPVLTRRHARNMPRDFVKPEAPLEQAGILRVAQIGAAEVRLVGATAMAELVLGMLARDPFVLLGRLAARRERKRYEKWSTPNP